MEKEVARPLRLKQPGRPRLQTSWLSLLMYSDLEETKEGEATFISSPPIRTALDNLKKKAATTSTLVRNLRRFVTGEINSLEDRVETATSRVKDRDNQINNLKEHNAEQEKALGKQSLEIHRLKKVIQKQTGQIDSIKSQVHLLTNQVDFLIQRNRQAEQAQQESEEDSEEEQQENEIAVGHIIKEES